MVKEAKAHTQFFWNDLDKIREFDNTHPHQWQELTDDEIATIIKEKDGVFGAVVRAIEQALRIKNG